MQIAFFEGRAVNAKIKTGRNSHAPVFHMQSYWWVWFPDIETRILEPAKMSAEGSVEPNSENVPLYGSCIYPPCDGSADLLV